MSNAVYFAMRVAPEAMTDAGLFSIAPPDTLSEVFRDLPDPSGDSQLRELSRLPTQVSTSGEGRVLSLSEATLTLLNAVIELARQQRIERLALVASVASERLLLRAGFNVHRVGAPVRVRDGLFVAMLMEITADAPGADCEMRVPFGCLHSIAGSR